jgi:L-lactate dehydrogenase (cytochrome)
MDLGPPKNTRLKNVTCIEDLRQIAHRRVPRAFVDYAEAGSYSASTLEANRIDLQKLKIRQRVLVGVAMRETRTTILGQSVPLPLALAPIGLGGLQFGNGEILACRAAKAAGIPYTLSTLSICSIEDVAEAVQNPFWFQLYIMKDRGFARSLIERAIAARCSALVLTVDLPILGQRHNDIKNGLSVPPSLRLANLLNMITKPRWVYGVLAGKRWTFGNLAGRLKGLDNTKMVAEWIAHQFDPALNWNDVEWVRSLWPGKLILKGILDVEDAKLAAKSGASTIVVSNHGGRQLDGAPSSISTLPKIADAVASDIEVLVDGGIRSGQDVFKALALGAQACLIGRAYVYGLGAAGEAGVHKSIEIIAKELDVTMALAGVRQISGINRSVLAN